MDFSKIKHVKYRPRRGYFIKGIVIDVRHQYNHRFSIAVRFNEGYNFFRLDGKLSTNKPVLFPLIDTRFNRLKEKYV
jgi:hypothetical protein